MRTNRVLILLAALLGICGSSVSAAPPNVLVRGSIASFTSKAITVKTSSGVVVLAYTAKTFFVGADPGSMADIVPGAFLGIANVPNTGASRALEVTVFDEKMRGMGEGDSPWQAPGVRSSMMTNGTVAKPKAAMMTNGTVGTMMNGDTKTITVNYKGGSRKIAVTKATPIVRVAPGSAKLLQANASVFISAKKSPTGLAAVFLVVGKNGTVVPL
jgi:hypothetical protein